MSENKKVCLELNKRELADIEQFQRENDIEREEDTIKRLIALGLGSQN